MFSEQRHDGSDLQGWSVLDTFIPNPRAEAKPLTEVERSDYKAIGSTMIVLSLIVIYVMIVYGGAAGWTTKAMFGFIAIYLSFFVPMAVSLLTLRKIFLALGLAIFGSFLLLSVLLAIVISPGVIFDAYIVFGLLFSALSLPLAYKIVKLEHPFYGLR